MKRYSKQKGKIFFQYRWSGKLLRFHRNGGEQVLSIEDDDDAVVPRYFFFLHAMQTLCLLVCVCIRDESMYIFIDNNRKKNVMVRINLSKKSGLAKEENLIHILPSRRSYSDRGSSSSENESTVRQETRQRQDESLVQDNLELRQVVETLRARIQDLEHRIQSGCYSAQVRLTYEDDKNDYILFSYFYEDEKRRARKGLCVYVYGLIEHICALSSQYHIVVSTNKTVHKVQLETEMGNMSLLEFLESNKISFSIFDCHRFAHNFLYLLYRFHPLTRPFEGRRNFFSLDTDTMLEDNQLFLEKVSAYKNESNVPTLVYNPYYESFRGCFLYQILFRHPSVRKEVMDSCFAFISEYCEHCQFEIKRSTIWLFLITSNASLMGGFTAFLHLRAIKHGSYFDKLFFDNFYNDSIKPFGLDEIYLKLYFIAMVVNQVQGDELESLFFIDDELMEPPPGVTIQTIIEDLETIHSARKLFYYLFSVPSEFDTFAAFLKSNFRNDEQSFFIFRLARTRSFEVRIEGNEKIQIEKVFMPRHQDKLFSDCKRISNDLKMKVIAESELL